MTKLCRRESKDTLRQKHALALCSRENNPSLIMTITKSRDDSCSSFLRAKLIRKEKRSAISHESIQDFSSTPLLQKSHPTEMLSFLAKKDKNKPSTYKPKVPPKYWTFFAKHITRMTEITICL